MSGINYYRKFTRKFSLSFFPNKNCLIIMKYNFWMFEFLNKLEYHYNSCNRHFFKYQR